MNYQWNLIPLQLPAFDITVGFQLHHFPNAYSVPKEELLPFMSIDQRISVQNTQYLYTSFVRDKESQFTFTIPYKAGSSLSKHYLRHKCRMLLSDFGEVRYENFVKELEWWILSNTSDSGNNIYKKYALDVDFDTGQTTTHLRLMYKGSTEVLASPLSSLPAHIATMPKRFICEGRCLGIKKVEAERLPRSSLYPIINGPLRKALGLPFPSPKPGENHVKKYVNEIGVFRKMLEQHDPFAKFFSTKDRPWLQASQNRIFKLPKESGLIEFGRGKRVLKPFEGVKSGPYSEAPLGTKVELFLIMHREDREPHARTLYYTLAERLEMLENVSNRFSEITGLQPVFHENHLKYSNEENPLPEIEAQLEELGLKPNVRYMGVYLSRINKHDENEARRQVYYQIKEFFLRKGIVTQVINRNTVSNERGFNYSLQNLFVAMLAKLGGRPWALAHPPEEALIVGVGAFSPKSVSGKYLGSAICFNSNGTFHEFDCFEESDTRLLSGTIIKAVKRYVSDHGKTKRLFIHFYKELSKKDLAPIQRVLDELDLDMDIVVCTVKDTRAYTFLMSEAEGTVYLPESGIYTPVPVRKHEYLLYNNQRYNKENSLRNWHPPLGVQLKSTNKALLDDPSIVEEVMRQLYQFSRLNYKTVSLKPMPVTVAYPKMVARIFPYFRSRSLDKLGRSSLWFL